MALVKYNNNSISAVSSAAAIPSGAMTLIKTLTASSSSTLSFVDGSSDVVLDSTYPIYKFEFINMHPSTDSVYFTFQGSTDGGSNYNTTITSSDFRAYHGETDGATALEYDASGTFDQEQGTAFQPLTQEVGNDNDQTASGTLQIFAPADTTFVKHFLSASQYSWSGDYSMRDFTGGYFNTTSAINAIQFKFHSGNIDAGTIKLYGIKDS